MQDFQIAFGKEMSKCEKKREKKATKDVPSLKSNNKNMPTLPYAIPQI